MSATPDTAVILAGSLATFHGLALGPYPKILLPLANRPLVHYQVQVLAEAGVKRLILCVAAQMAAELSATARIFAPAVVGAGFPIWGRAWQF